MSISIDERQASEIRKLVEAGSFKTISAAFEEAATILIERQTEKAAWWAETIRRCEDADQYPGQSIPAETFFSNVRADIAAMGKGRRRGK